MSEKRKNVRFIPQNIIGGNRIGHIFKTRNFIEGIIFAGIGIAIVTRIDFLIQVKILFCVIAGSLLFLIGVWGIGNHSVTSFIFFKIRHKIMAKKYHIRSINDVKKANTSRNRGGENLTTAEAIYYGFKDVFDENKRNGEKTKLKDITDVLKVLFED